MSSAICFNLDQSENLSFGNELKLIPRFLSHPYTVKGDLSQTIKIRPFANNKDQDQIAQNVQSDL